MWIILKKIDKNIIDGSNKNMKKLIKQIRKKIEKNFGKKCKDYCFGCSVCAAHRVLEDLESMYNDDWNTEPVKKKKK